jgi:hypothetical protein
MISIRIKDIQDKRIAVVGNVHNLVGITQRKPSILVLQTCASEASSKIVEKIEICFHFMSKDTSEV